MQIELTEELIQEILHEGKLGFEQLAKEYGVSEDSRVYMIMQQTYYRVREGIWLKLRELQEEGV